MWLWSREKTHADDWFPPMQFALARATLGLLVIAYFALWPLEPGSVTPGVEVWLELPRLGRGLLRLAAFAAGVLLVLGWARRIAGFAGALLGLALALNGRADPGLTILLVAGLIWISLPAASEPLRVPPFNQEHPGVNWPSSYWVRARWFLIGGSAIVAHWVTPAWLSFPGQEVVSLALGLGLGFVALRGPNPRIAAALAFLFVLIAVFTSGLSALPAALWCLFFCLDNTALPALPPPRVAPSPDPAELDEPVSLIVFFDGVCGLCQHSVQLALEEDRTASLHFAPLQGPTAARWLNRADTDPLDSIKLYDAGQIYDRSTGALRIARYLGGMWRLLSWARIIPEELRDAVYDFIAEHRYQWFGKLEACRIPTPAERARFLD